MAAQSFSVVHPTTSSRPQASFFGRYRHFLLSWHTLVTLACAILLGAGFILSVTGMGQLGRWLYLASALVGGAPLFLLAARGLLRRDLTAGFMVSTATIAAIVVGEYSAAALVVLMMAVGEWLENLTIARADNALKDLARLMPAMVTVQREGREVLLPLEQVVAGETMLVRSGERIGADGVVIAGRAAVSQAAITGEGLPVDKVEGDEVFAGTLNERGVLQVRVTRVGEDTTLGQIVRLVKDAQRTQAPVQRLANRYAQFLVPLSFAVAILVFALTRDIMRSITVLVVVCPCALVLSTPTAVVAAIGNAAKRGILVRSGASMEQIGRVDVVALDKTGTLTCGKPVLCEVTAWHGTPERMLQFAAAAERYSEHPIGRALVAGAEQRGLVLSEPQDVTILPGYGITARVEGLDVIVGSQALLAERSVAWPAVAGERTAQLEQEGYTVIPVALDGRVAGLLGLADALRPAAAAAVAALKALGIDQVSIISGDNRGAVARVARELGIDSFHAQVLPQDKLAIIRQLRAAGKRVAYVGDGVNDAPALAAADIGIAMGLAGTDVAIETASICLTADEIERVPQAITLSRRALLVIKQNVAFSMGVNVLAVALGSLGIIGPVAGALIHELSALPVLANSARLINHRRT